MGVSPQAMMDENLINKQLKRQFGAQDDKANFRLARTDNQYEYRRISDNIIEQLPKYTYLPRGYWVIERLLPVTGINADVLPGIKFSYEPVYVFRNFKNDEPIAVVEDIVYAIVHAALFKEKMKIKRDWEAEELAFYNKQVERALEFIEDECSPMSMQLHFGEAVVKGERKVDG